MTAPARILFSYAAHQFVIESGDLPFVAADMGHDVTVAVLWNSPPAKAFALRCREAGLRVLHYAENMSLVDTDAGRSESLVSHGKATPSPETEARRGRLLPSLLRKVLPPDAALRRLFALPSYFKQSARAKRVATDIIRAAREPNVYFAASFGSTLGIENHISRFVRKIGGRIFCYPTYPCYGEDIYIRRRFQAVDIGMWSDNLRAESDWINRLFARLFPSWTRSYQGRSQFAKDPIELFAAWCQGMLYYDAWAKPFQIYDRVYVPYKFSVEILRRNKYLADQVTTLGKPSIDRVASACVDESFVRQMQADLGYSPRESFILFNVAPSAEHQNTTVEKHMAQFTAICEALSRTDEKVIMSLHPICRFETYNEYAKRYGFTISQKYSIYHLQPFCRFVMSHFCTTNYQAALLGKKVIDVDYLGLRFEENLSLMAPEEIHPNIFITAPEELDAVVDRLMAETEKLSHADNSYYRNHVPAAPQIIADAMALAAR